MNWSLFHPDCSKINLGFWWNAMCFFCKHFLQKDCSAALACARVSWHLFTWLQVAAGYNTASGTKPGSLSLKLLSEPCHRVWISQPFTHPSVFVSTIHSPRLFGWFGRMFLIHCRFQEHLHPRRLNSSGLDLSSVVLPNLAAYGNVQCKFLLRSVSDHRDCTGRISLGYHFIWEMAFMARLARLTNNTSKCSLLSEVGISDLVDDLVLEKLFTSTQSLFWFIVLWAFDKGLGSPSKRIRW